MPQPTPERQQATTDLPGGTLARNETPQPETVPPLESTGSPDAAVTQPLEEISSSKGIPSPNPNSVPSIPTVSANDLPEPLRDHIRYRILKKLGEGGMGAVYLAEHKLMHRPVALKLIRAELAAQPRLIQRFQREVQAAARLTNPHIVHAYDAEQAGQCHFLVMEYVEGTDLAHLLQERGPLPVPEACEYVRQAALGLQHAHEHRLIHRDLKPQNLMRTADGTVKILDFGVARAVQPAQESEGGTASGVILGTPDYMAPEQAADASTVDIRADIYSLGCTLYHLLAGRVPFPCQSVLSKLSKHAHEQPAPLDEQCPHLPAEVGKIVARMMAKDPAARYQTPAEVANALKPWCQPHRETQEIPKAQTTLTETIDFPSSISPFLRSRGLLVVVLLMVLGALATSLLSTRLGSREDRAGNDKAPSHLPSNPPDRATPLDMSQVKPVIDDDFSGTAKLPFFPPGERAERYLQENRATIRLQDRCLVLGLQPGLLPPRQTSCGPPPQCTNFVCEIRCRATGKGDGGWGMYHDDGGDTTLWVMVRLDGGVEVNESGRTPATAFHSNLGTFRPPSTGNPEDFTTLLVERRGPLLTVFLDGQAVGDPLRLERKYAGGHQYIAVWDRDGGEARAEFARYRLWRLP